MKTSCDMRTLLVSAAPEARRRGWFEPRNLFRQRVGRSIIYPLGLGSALNKAVRDGYLELLDHKWGRNRRYAFTEAGFAYASGSGRMGAQSEASP